MEAEDRKTCTGLGPSSGMQQVGLLVSWQGPRGQASSAGAHTKAGAQSRSHPFPWVEEHRFRNSHDWQQPK